MKALYLFMSIVVAGGIAYGVDFMGFQGFVSAVIAWWYSLPMKVRTMFIIVAIVTLLVAIFLIKALRSGLHAQTAFPREK